MARKRPFKRTDRLASQVREALALALLRDTREEILREIVITDVEVTSDVSLARVYWHGVPGVADRDTKAVEAALARANGFLRSKVGEAIMARITPELRFHYDDALDRGRRIDQILHGIALEERPVTDETPSSDDEKV